MELIKIKKIIRFITDYLEDILIFSGLIAIIIATFLLSKIAGIYCLGGCLFGLGVYFTKFPTKRG
jgi:hypothetical protein